MSLTIKDVERIRRAAWLIEDNELGKELVSASRAYNKFKAIGNVDKSEWYRLYYWAIRNEISNRWR
jgi:hypothetical protein